ncbi:hypothetical protein K2173_011715 [Erythroxylum novogranatense]|uniref:Uncharacterized protein n=1 Tax=Erythroxylum novogranatense TaxID=1862640 RepID=A0AAV8T168_9ROSI|nr:hypothetical protein K2173_011715 [Erythroxylum novogranatense]
MLVREYLKVPNFSVSLHWSDSLNPEVAGSMLSSNPAIPTVLASKIFNHLFPNCTLFQYYYIRSERRRLVANYMHV